VYGGLRDAAGATTGCRAEDAMRRRTLFMVLGLTLALWPRGGAAAPCCGDCNGDGAVTINELITAVNNALDGCGAATPTAPPAATPTPTVTATPGRTSTPTKQPTKTATPLPTCPFTFSDQGAALCQFLGPFNRGCGNQLNSVFSSDGSTLVVTIDTMLDNPPTVAFGAQITDGANATLTVWSTDNFQTMHPTAGTVQLTGGGQQLVIFPNNSPFMILGCNFVQYIGDFVSSRGRQRAGSDVGAAFERLRAGREAPPELAMP
jgi:hypothetical protein